MNQQTPTPTDAEMESNEPLTEDTGYTIELKVSADGTIQVGVETEAKEAAESGEDGEEQYQTCKDIGEALRLVKDIYKHAGDLQASGQDAKDIESGYI